MFLSIARQHSMYMNKKLNCRRSVEIFTAKDKKENRITFFSEKDIIVEEPSSFLLDPHDTELS